MKILITGTTGYVGRHLVSSAVSAGHKVFTLNRRPSKTTDNLVTKAIVCDILNVTAADLPKRLDVVIHLATGNDGNREHICRVAMEGTRAMFLASKERAVKFFIHVSSMSAYPGPIAYDGNGVDGPSLEPNPSKRAVYAESKTLADRTLQELVRSDGADAMSVVIVRPGLVFGVDMPHPLVGTAVQLPLGLAIGLGKADGTVPLLDVADLSEGLIALVESQPDSGRLHFLDILSGPPPSKRSFLELYSGFTGRAKRHLWLPRWFALCSAFVVDTLLRFRGGSRSVPYKVRRLYDFDPAALDHERFWKNIGRQPKGDARNCLIQALTLDRAPEPGDGAAARAGERAQSLLKVANAGSISNHNEDLILLGAGRIINEMHLPVLKTLTECKVRAVIDPNMVYAEAVAATFPGSKAYEGLEEVDDALLAGATAVVATPGFTHATLTRTLLQRGAAVLLEKPAALTYEDFAQLIKLERATGLPITVFQNYRLRPNTLKLWHFLVDHDVGAPVRIHLRFQPGRVFNEAARWSHAEKQYRVLILEMAIHFFDIIMQVTGPFTSLSPIQIVNRSNDLSTISVAGQAQTAAGATLTFELDLSGTAQATQIQMEFERSAVVLDFFPEGFTVLPQQRNPIDDAAGALARFSGFVWQKIRPTRDGLTKRALPHALIYREHLNRRANPVMESPFSLASIKDTMNSLFALCEHVYKNP